ncbi:uncharacterized protein LOC110675153 [Aedes aegypti]|uniref:Uncharacterized protein n=1 Tax=Aedes aegypti TaxID=7159 RepID=A0A6I8U3N3_AEDAE|nr:uncharacterized protein LOC110675153 [Aedes aegypti]
MKTFNERDRVRKSGEFHKYLEDFPVATCFDGKLLKLDFQKLYPAAPKFWDRFEDLKPKVLTTYSSTLQHIGNETIRTLGIIWLKNPTRGMKRTIHGNDSNDNPLNGIVEWIQYDDPMPVNESDNPILYMRGNFPDDNCEGTISWRKVRIVAKQDFFLLL